MGTIFTNISECLTLAPAMAKKGRRIASEDIGIIKSAVIIVERGKILWLGKETRIPKEFQKFKKHSLKKKTVIPAFTECHTHTVFGGSRAEEFELKNTGISYEEIGKRGGGIYSTVKATRKTSLEKLLLLSQERVSRFVAQGVTTLEVKSGYGLNWKTEKKMLEVANELRGPKVVPTFLGAHALSPEFDSYEDYVTELIENQLPKVKKLKLAHRVDVFLERNYFSKKLAQKYLKAAQRMGFDLVVHADQLSRTGATALAVQMKALSADHAIELSKEDISKLVKSETTSVLLPLADFYIKTPYPPAREIIDRGGRVALATDYNPGSAPSQDISTVGVLARVEMKMTLAEVIAAYTVGSAFALGEESRVGSLEVGKDADFLVLNGNWRELFHSIGQNSVSETWKSGKKLNY